MDDLIDRQAAIDALGEQIEQCNKALGSFDISPKDEYAIKVERASLEAYKEQLENMLSAQPGQRNARVFQGIIVEYPSISAYPEYEGKPYFSIKYTENGQEFIGYGTYKPEVLSEYLKEYFMPPTQPGGDIRAMCGECDAWNQYKNPQPGWIPWDSGGFPEESGTYTVTAYDGAKRRVTYAKYQKRLKRWELKGARAYWRVLAWCPPPEPYREVNE